MIRYHFDLYPRDDPKDGTRLVRFTKLQSAEYRGEANGTGAGRFTIRADTDEAAFIDPLGLQYVRVVREDTSDASEVVVGGFWLDNGDFEALTTNQTRKLTFGGAGTLAYLQRAIMASHTYLSNDIDPTLGAFDDAMDPFDDIWRLSNQGFGNTLGAMLWRVIKEASLAPSGAYTHRHKDGADHTDFHADDRPTTAIPDLTWDFDQDDDSSSGVWVATAGDFKAQVGESVLSVVKRLMEAGLYVEMDPDTFELHAWEAADHRRDRTGAAWGSSVIRFQAPTSDDITTGNIKSDAKRGIAAFVKRSWLLAGGHDTYGDATGSSDIPWEGFYSADSEDTTALNGIASTQLGARDDAGDTLRLRMRLGSDTANGYYRPFEDILLDDLATVHTGTGQWDYNEDTFPVAALTISLRPGGDWDAWADLGSTYTSMAERAFQARGVASHSHPPNPQLCDARRNVILGLSDTSLKSASEDAALPRENAVDGSDATGFSHVTSGDAAEDYFAADLGSSRAVQSYRFLAGGNASDYASTIAIYGSNDDGAWTWLPSGKISADPASNGWTLVTTLTGLSVSSDTGEIGFGSDQTYRYWLFRATAGASDAGASDWDIQEVELWAHRLAGNDPRAARCGHGHLIEELVTNEIDTTKTIRPDGQGGLEWGDQEPVGGSVRVRDVLAAIPYPVAGHRGDPGSPDGYPEDSLEGIVQAAIKGCELVEVDVCQNADGTFWCIHDTTVDRVTAGTGNVSDKTDAQMAALTFDAGFGYDAGRHGSSISLCTLDDVFDALEQTGKLLILELKGGSETDLAQAVVDAGWASRTIIEVPTEAMADNIKAVSPVITVAGDPTNATAEWLPRDIDTDLTSRADVLAFAPKVVKAYVSINDYGSDETTWLTNAFDWGARVFQTNNVDAALADRGALYATSGGVGALDDLSDVTITSPQENDDLRYNGSAWVNDSRKWEAVTNGEDIFVWEGDDLVHEWSA